jgi:hypothetical protein
MPHLDSILLRTPFAASGQSRFARPVAAVTVLARRLARALARAGAQPPKAPTPRIRQDLEVREIEEHYSRATDLADLERMERAYDRRDAGGMRSWDWK